MFVCLHDGGVILIVKSKGINYYVGKREIGLVAGTIQIYVLNSEVFNVATPSS